MYLSHRLIAVPQDMGGFIRTRGTEEIRRLCAGCCSVMKRGLSSEDMTG